MANFRHGVTSLQDVVTALGPASVETALDDGSTLLVYTYVTSRPHPETYLPFIGALVGGADTHSSAAVFLFDSHGLLKSARRRKRGSSAVISSIMRHRRTFGSAASNSVIYAGSASA